VPTKCECPHTCGLRQDHHLSARITMHTTAPTQAYVQPYLALPILDEP
jgi:hypothetical protein